MFNIEWLRKQRNTKNYRRFVTQEKNYEIIGNKVFNFLVEFGLKPNNTLLDIGCGSLRIGQHIIRYLDAYNYYGIEPEKWLIEESIKNEFKPNVIDLKNPHFDFNNQWEPPDKIFDYIIIIGVLCHAPESQIKQCLKNIKKCFSKNTKLILNYKNGLIDYVFNDWNYPGTVSYSKKKFESFLKGYKFEYLDFLTCNGYKTLCLTLE